MGTGTDRAPARQGLLRRHRGVVVAAVLVAMAAVAFVLVWFQPQALFIDRVVDEEFPEIPAGAEALPGTDAGSGEAGAGEADAADGPDGPVAQVPQDAEAGTQPGVPVAVLQGDFESRGRYSVTGTATVYELSDGSRIVRLEAFESTNGPDLLVYLTATDSAADDLALNADFVDLGVLRGNIGSQNYDIPADVDLARYDTVVIWCRRFTVGFGAADLEPVG